MFLLDNFPSPDCQWSPRLMLAIFKDPVEIAIIPDLGNYSTIACVSTLVNFGVNILKITIKSLLKKSFNGINNV